MYHSQLSGGYSVEDIDVNSVCLAVDEEGNPIANKKFEITMPDGSTRSGKLDKDGFARVECGDRFWY